MQQDPGYAVEPRKVWKSDARAPGLRALRAAVDEGSGQRSLGEHSLDEEVQATKERPPTM